MSDVKPPKKKKSLVRRIFKWTGITFLVLLITAIILPFIFKDKIIEYIKKEANDNLNATVSWGDFDLSLISSFPSFRFYIKDVKVIGKDEFLKDTLASIPEMRLDLDLMSVIKGDQYKVNSVLLDKPRVNVKVLKNGKANYDITKPSAPTKDAAPQEATKFKLALKKLSLKNAYIVYDDASLAVKTVLDNFTYDLSGDFTQDVFLMENELTIDRFSLDYDGMTYLKNVKTKASAALDMDMLKWKFTFKENEFNLNDLALGLDGFFEMPGDDYNMDLKFNAKQSEFRSFLSLIPGAYTSDFASVKTSGKLAFNGYLKGLYSDKQRKMPGAGVTLKITDASVQYPSVPKAITAINVDAKYDDPSGDPNQAKIDVNKLHMDFGGNPIDGGLHVSTPVSDPNMDGWLKCKLNLSSLKDVMPLEKGDELNGNIDADIKMKGKYSQIEHEQYDQFDCSGTVAVMNMLYKTKSLPYDMNINAMNLNFSPQFVAMTKFDGKIGKNDMHADGKIDNLMTYLFKDSLLHGNFNFNSSLMDLNQFMGEQDASSTPAAADTAAMEVIPVPGNIDFTLTSTIGKLIYDDINMDHVSGKVRIVNEMVDISGLKMDLMGGSMVMGGNYSTQNDVPSVDLDLDISNFDIQQTFKYFNTVQKLAPVSKYTSGKFSTHLKYKSDLDQAMMPIVTTINGGGTLSTNQVEVSGFEPLKKLDDALKMNKFKKITLSDLKMVSFKIENGRVSTEPFDFKSGKSSGKMGGSTGVDQSINYVMDMAIPRSEFGPVNSALDGMVSSVQSKGIPFKLGDVVNVQALFGGTVTNPTVKVNLKEAGGNIMDALKDSLKNVVKDKVDSVKHNVINQACVEADKQLTTAIDAAKRTKDAAYKTADDLKVKADAEALKLENSYKNPLEKAAKKLAADKARQAAVDANKKAKQDADNAYTNSVNAAQAKRDAACK